MCKRSFHERCIEFRRRLNRLYARVTYTTSPCGISCRIALNYVIDCEKTTIMAARHRRFVHRFQPINRDRIFRDRTNPLDVYDDIELHQRFNRFRRHDLIKILDEFEVYLYVIKSFCYLPRSFWLLSAFMSGLRGFIVHLIILYAF